MRKVLARRSIDQAARFLRTNRRRGASLLAAVLACALAPARAQTTTASPQAQQPAASLADSLKRADNTQLHIFYVHGMAFDGPYHSDSYTLRQSICKHLGDCTAPEGVFDKREYADKRSFAEDATPPYFSYLGEYIWKSRQGGDASEGWHASTPFVDHYLLLRRGAPTIYVDEINWWPLVFSAKCRQIVAKDAELAGPSKPYIATCATTEKDEKNPGRFLSYSWIEPGEAKRLEALPAKGARLNRGLKNNVLDWGFSDAVLSVGAMRNLLLEGIRQLILKSVNVAADGTRGPDVEPAPNQEFVIVSHSLGSYLIFSALDFRDSDSSPKQPWKQQLERILGRTSAAYFFANQLRLLELANLDVTTGANMVQHLETWGCLRLKYLGSACDSTRNALLLPKVVAWSDPSDLLSWDVPALSVVCVENRYVQNAIHWFWLFESPTKAHGNYVTDKRVIAALFQSARPCGAP
ncbi:MAG: hypothetical protein ACRD59_05345 [Candidatus Acidiferrales bacterium]